MMGLAEARRKHPSDQTLFGQQMVSRADRTRRNPLSKEPPDKTGSLFDERRSLPIQFLPEKLESIEKKRFPMPWSKPESRSPPPLSRRRLVCKTDDNGFSGDPSAPPATRRPTLGTWKRAGRCPWNR